MDKKKIGISRTPLSIIAIFASLSEIAMTVTLLKIDKEMQSIFIWFVMLFPIILVACFFYTLYTKPAVLFSPLDYENDITYLSSIGKNSETDIFSKQMAEILEIAKNTNSFVDNIKQISINGLHSKREKYNKSSPIHSVPKIRDIDGKVTDPFLLYIRKLSGLEEEWSEAEKWSLEKKELSAETDDPKKLMSLASSSYMEGDGQYAMIYLERVKACKGIGPKTMRYLDASIKRLENPDMFGESLGIMVMEIEPCGLFEAAGIIEGDIIYELNEKPLHEPEEISRALGWGTDYSFLLTIRRDGKTITKPITPGKSAGALTWALVTFYQSRL
jgi:hypothetical protein